MVEFETLRAERIEFGTRNFLEVARKVAISQDGRHEFVSIARGYRTKDGNERWKTNLTVPDNADVIEWLRDELEDIKPAPEPDEDEAEPPVF